MRSPNKSGGTGGTGESRAPGKLTPEAFALALLLASSLQIMENLLPRIPIFPWLKLGLSYVVILPFLLRFGPVPAFALLFGRNLLGVLYGGQVFSTFLISTISGAVTFLIIGFPAAWLYHRKVFGTVGTSVALATTFNLSQLFLVEWMLIGHSGFFFQIGPLLAWSVASGLGVAYLIRLSESDLSATWDWDREGERERDRERTGDKGFGSSSFDGPMLPSGNVPLFFFALLLMGGIFGVSSLLWQSLSLPLFLLAASGFSRRGLVAILKTLLYAWPLFFYLAWLHLFHTSGRLIGYGMTQEGVEAFGLHAVRLVNLILVGQWIVRLLPLGWMRRSTHPFLRGFLIALPLLPGLFRFSLEAGKQIARRWFKGERRNLLKPVFEAWMRSLNPGSGFGPESP